MVDFGAKKVMVIPQPAMILYGRGTRVLYHDTLKQCRSGARLVG